MKKFSFLWLFVLLATVTMAQDAKHISPAVKSATVFLNGAILTQSATVNLRKGNNEIILTNLASGIDENTIKVKVNGKAFVVSINKMLNHIVKNRESKEALALKDSLKFYEKKRTDLNAEINVLRQKLTLLNNLLQKGNGSLTLTQVKKSLQFFNKESAKLNYKIENDKQLFNKIMERISDIKKQLSELNSLKPKPVNEVGVVINSQKNRSAEVTVSYFTRSASWRAFYNIYSNGFGSPVVLTMNANVKQQTGIEWKDISLTISTRNPYLNNNKPELNPWFIDFQKTYPVMMYKSAKAQDNRVANTPEQSAVDFVHEKVKDLSVEYNVKLNFPIPPDGKGRLVEIKKQTFNADYYYSLVPKYSSNGFLVCKIMSWKPAGWLPGNANIYYENSYVGKTYINPQTTGKEFTLSLGQDVSIKAQRKLVKDFKEGKFLSGDVKRIFNYEIIVKNNKQKSCNVTVEDQVPVSKDEKIKVEVTETSGAAYSEKNGKVVWKLKLKPGEKKILKLNFTVTYPGDKEISGL